MLCPLPGFFRLKAACITIETLSGEASNFSTCDLCVQSRVFEGAKRLVGGWHVVPAVHDHNCEPRVSDLLFRFWDMISLVI